MKILEDFRSILAYFVDDPEQRLEALISFQERFKE